jgi:hypothetical protein
VQLGSLIGVAHANAGYIDVPTFADSVAKVSPISLSRHTCLAVLQTPTSSHPLASTPTTEASP